tara:strand:- start:12758 stop:12955 length:198 start_codon:yes stop_codon:yes gene_type:complete
MADDVDTANDINQMLLDIALKKQSAKKETLPNTGKCHNCTETVKDGARFCDRDCRDDYTRRKANK